jgi:oligoribonuclease
MSPNSGNLIWVDLEMTGLDVASHAILEIAVIVTDRELKELGRWPAGGSGQAVAQPEGVLDRASPWVRENLPALLERVRTSDIDLTTAEERALRLVREFCPDPGPSERGCPLAGNSVGSDRAFLRAYMPRLEGQASYRNVDVSTIKELVQRWYPAALWFDKDSWLGAHYPGGKHNAMVDLLASIAELEFYRSTIFLNPRCAPAEPSASPDSAGM